MADDKRGREKQARDEERRQQERDVAAELERSDEAEPPVESELDEVEAELDSLEFPVTGAEVVAAAGEVEVGTPDGTATVAALVPDSGDVSFNSPSAVRVRLRRPDVAAAMKRIVEASETLRDPDFRDGRRDTYEKTLQALRAIDADDEDEGIGVVTDWVVERIREDGTLPGSRAVRRRAAKFCRANGYEIRNDEWLGV